MIDLFGPRPVTQAWREWTPVASLGVEVHDRTWNDSLNPVGPPLVLVAGLGVSSRYWLRLGRRLATSFHVYAPDLPGFGRSPKLPNSPWPAGPTVTEQANELIAWMDARRLSKVVLCGHSTGGQVTVDVATRYPERVEKVILIAPTFDPSRLRLWTYLPRLAIASWFESPSLTPLLAFEYLSAGVPRVLQMARRFIKDPVEPKLPGLTQPTLVLAGQWDLLVPTAWTDLLSSKLKNATLVSIDRVGHAPQYSAAATTAAVIRDFLAGQLLVGPRLKDGAIVAPEDDPQHDKLGPPQPISPTVHGLLDYATALAAVALPRICKWGPRTKWVLTRTAAASVAGNLVSDHGASAAKSLAGQGVPMLAHASADIVSGIHLLTAAATYLRHEKPAARWATAALGAYQIASALLTAKPTGPARVRR